MARLHRGFERRDFLRLSVQGVGWAALGSSVGGALLRQRPPPHDLDAAQSIASVRPPRIITRAEWGADESLRSGSPDFEPVSKLIIHHTAVPDGSGDPKSELQAILRGHVRRGFNDIGYNFVIDRQGRIYEGRWARNYAAGEVHSGESTAEQGVVGAHARGHNHGSVGIALLGNFSGSQHPTPAAIEALISLLAWKADRHGIDPEGSTSFPNVAGHRQVGSTTCPGDNLLSRLPEIRRKTALRIADGFIGYRLVASDGTAHSFGGAAVVGDVASAGGRASVVGGAPVPNGQGYWLVDASGGVFGFGGARYEGSIPRLRGRGVNVGRSRIIGIAATPTGRGYWLYDAIGGVFSFGDAQFFGSVPALRNAGVRIGRADIVTMAPTPSGRGYWVLDRAGGIFSFGDARFFGSVPALRDAGVRVGRADMVSMAPTPSGRGYWLIDDIGGVFSFGDARFRGSLPQSGVHDPPARRIVATRSGRGYVIATRSGAVYSFGDAPFYGRRTTGDHVVDLVPVIRR